MFEKALDNAVSISKTTANGQIDITQLFSEEELSESLPKIVYPDVSEFSTKELLLFEKDVLGMCFSGKILDSYSKHLNKLNPKPISDIISDENLTEKASANVAGIIVSRSIKKTKKDDEMAFIRISDSLGEIELVVFPKAYERYADKIFINNVIFAKGTISIKEDEAPKIIVNELENVYEDIEYEKKLSESKIGKLYLKVSSVKNPLVGQIVELLKQYNGNSQVIFYDMNEKKYIKALDVSIDVSDDILNALKSLLGDDCVVFKD